MVKTTSPIVTKMFTKVELASFKLPPTVGSQFKISLNALVDILRMKSPWYIRCIKPNHTKSSSDSNRDLMLHQIKYLGLMENLRVRRAGFAYRRTLPYFVERYKSLCPKTWPIYTVYILTTSVYPHNKLLQISYICMYVCMYTFNLVPSRVMRVMAYFLS